MNHELDVEAGDVVLVRFLAINWNAVEPFSIYFLSDAQYGDFNEQGATFISLDSARGISKDFPDTDFSVQTTGHYHLASKTNLPEGVYTVDILKSTTVNEH